MPKYLLWNFSREVLLASSLRVVRGLFQRLRNFLRFRPPRAGEAVLVSHCLLLPTYYAREPLDLVFLDDRGYVVGTVRCAAPRHSVRRDRRASDVVALPANALQTVPVSVGDRLSLIWTRPPRE